MKYNYRVYHSATGAPAAANLRAEEEQHEYDHFPGALSHMFDHAGIAATSRPAVGKRGVIVVLETEYDESVAAAALESLVKRLNARSPELCLVIDRL